MAPHLDGPPASFFRKTGMSKATIQDWYLTFFLHPPARELRRIPASLSMNNKFTVTGYRKPPRGLLFPLDLT